MVLLRWTGTAVFLLTAAAPRGLPQTQLPGPSQGTIEGRVVDSITGAPVRDAQVTYRQSGKPGGSAISDGGGYFRFREVPPGEYSFLASARNYKIRLGVGTVTVRPSQTLSDVTLRLVPFSSLSGQITNDDGGALADMEVELWRFTYLSGVRGLRAENGWTYTDRQGLYRFQSIPPGRYYVSASARTANQPGASETEQGRYVRRFYPGTLDSEAAAPVDLPAGSDLANVNFRLSKTIGVTIRGQVKSSSIADVTLAPETFQFSSGLSAKTSLPDGRFEIRGVLPGRYTIKAHLKRGDEEEWASRSLAVGTGDVEGLDLLPLPAPSIAGHIRADGTSDGTDLSALVLELRPADRASGSIIFFEKANGEGMVRIADVSPGRFRLGVSYLPPGFYVKEVRSGNQEIANRVLDLTAGSTAQVEVILSRNAATVTGSVYLDDPARPFPGAIVVLLPQEKNRAEDRTAYLWASADGAGRFALHNVPPGEYLAFAWEDINLTDNVFMDPAFMANVKTSGVPLSLAERVNAGIEIPVALEQ